MSERKQLDVPSFAAHSARGLIRERKTRRRIMLAAILLAAAFLVVATMIDTREHLVLALVGWFACAWMTISGALLAIYDLLTTRREERVLRQGLERQVEGRD